MSIIFKLGINSNTAVTIRPDFDYELGKKQIRNDHRTRGGHLYMYKWSDYIKIKFKTEFVPATDAAVINSWFDTNTDLLWFVTSGGVTDVYSVVIVNDDTPLKAHTAPYAEYYSGKIELEGY